MYRYKCVPEKGNNNSLELDRALQTRVMPRRSPGMLQGWRQGTVGSEGFRQVCVSHKGAYMK